MKQTFNTIINGFGVLCILIGFCVYIGAGRASDLDADMIAQVIPMLIKGCLLMFGGLFLSWWRA